MNIKEYWNLQLSILETRKRELDDRIKEIEFILKVYEDTIISVAVNLNNAIWTPPDLGDQS